MEDKYLGLIQALKEKTPCPREFQCLEEDGEPHCQAEKSRVNAFTLCKSSPPNCPFVVVTMGERYCSCLVRVHLCNMSEE